MSENKIAASKPNRSIGCMVTSQANSGVLQSVKKSPACLRVARYSGKYRPACRITQIGVRSTFSPRKVRK